MERVNVHTNLHVQLTNGEMAQRAHDCAVLIDEFAKSESEFKEIKKKWTGEHKEIKSRISILAMQHVTGKEHRDVPCIACVDLVKRWTWYEYNGDRYNERAMTEYEVAQVKQRALFNDGINVDGIVNQTGPAKKPGKQKLKAVDPVDADDELVGDEFEETTEAIL